MRKGNPEHNPSLYIKEPERLTFEINPDTKKRIIPDDWKGRINEILKLELLQENRNYASKKDLLIKNVARESSKGPEKFYSDLVERWKWHNEFYEELLEPALPLILEESPLDLSAIQIDSLKQAYITSSLVDSATLASSAAIKSTLQKWIDQNKHLPPEEISLILTPPRESFWTQYHVDHLRYLEAIKRADGSDLEIKRTLLKKYHINDEEIFKGRISEFRVEANLSEEELEERVSEMLMPESKKVEHFYQTLERPRQKAISKIVEFDNIEEYDLLTNLVGISGFILRKRILSYLDQAKILPNDGKIYGVEDDKVLAGLDKLGEYRKKYMEKKVSHLQQSSSETCTTACAAMALEYLTGEEANFDLEQKLFEKCRSKLTTGTLFSALAGELAEEGREVRLIHSEKEMFKYSREVFDQETYDGVLAEYSSFVDPKKYEVVNGEEINENKIRSLLENNFQIILAGFLGGNILHSVLVSGYNEQGYILHDPLGKKLGTWTPSRLERFSKTPIGSWLIALRPKMDSLKKLNERNGIYQLKAREFLGMTEEEKEGGGSV